MPNIPIKYLLIIVSLILIGYGVQGLRNDRVKEDGGEIIDRYQSPDHYWFNVAVYIGLGIIGISFALIVQ